VHLASFLHRKKQTGETEIQFKHSVLNTFTHPMIDVEFEDGRKMCFNGNDLNLKQITEKLYEVQNDFELEDLARQTMVEKGGEDDLTQFLAAPEKKEKKDKKK